MQGEVVLPDYIPLTYLVFQAVLQDKANYLIRRVQQVNIGSNTAQDETFKAQLFRHKQVLVNSEDMSEFLHWFLWSATEWYQ